MDLLKVKSWKGIILNILIALGLGVFIALNFKAEHVLYSSLLLILPSSSLVFISSIKNSQTKNRKEKDIIINTSIYYIIYVIIYELTLVAYKIDFQIIAKLLYLQILYLIIEIQKYFANRIDGNIKKVFYFFFTGAVLAAGIYAVKNNWYILNTLLLLTEALVLVPSTYLVIMFTLSKQK